MREALEYNGARESLKHACDGRAGVPRRRTTVRTVVQVALYRALPRRAERAKWPRRDVEPMGLPAPRETN
jgi:hypothetical protein